MNVLKRISFLLAIFFVINTVSFNCNAFEQNENISIQREYLCNSSDAEIFNRYTNEILSFINQKVDEENEYYNWLSENSHPDRQYVPKNIKLKKFSDNGFDFTNGKKFCGIKSYKQYFSMKENAKFDDVMSELNTQSYDWDVTFNNGVTYCRLTFFHNNEEFHGYGHIDYDFITLNEDWDVAVSLDYNRGTSSVYSKNQTRISYLKNLIALEAKEGNVPIDSEIKVVPLRIGRWTHAYAELVFINGKAKYAFQYQSMMFNIKTNAYYSFTDELFIVPKNPKLFDYNDFVKKLSAIDLSDCYDLADIPK